MSKEILRDLPKVDEILNCEEIKNIELELDDEYIVEIIREEINFVREKILLGKLDSIDIEKIKEDICCRLEKEFDFGLKKVINATGVVLHTNLGRAPMSSKIKDKFENILYGYCNLEYDIESGKRGSRHSHLKKLIQKLTGAEDVIVVNNNAAAVMLVLSTIAKDKEVVISRGELVEIGGSFRIPKVIEHSGAVLKEVGSTNKTHLKDYKEVISDKTGALMKVHTSNFKVMGFTDSVNIRELRSIADEYNLPLIDDLGSGVFIDLRKYGLEYEPTVQDSLNAGADIVTFSGDKLMGGAQCGIIVGKSKYIEEMKKNNLLRALRVDKMTIENIASTLKIYLDKKNIEKNIPVLSMLSKSEKELEKKAKILWEKINNADETTIVKCNSMVGGGSLPTQLMNSYGIKINPKKMSISSFEKSMRLLEPHIVGRVEEDSYFIDVRTIFEDEIDIIANKIKEIL